MVPRSCRTSFEVSVSQGQVVFMFQIYTSTHIDHDDKAHTEAAELSSGKEESLSMRAHAESSDTVLKEDSLHHRGFATSPA